LFFVGRPAVDHDLDLMIPLSKRSARARWGCAPKTGAAARFSPADFLLFSRAPFTFMFYI
jgi:hypothetical protein